MAENNTYDINFLLSALLKKIVVPTEFHNKCQAIEEMLEDDVAGIVDTLTDFSVQSADVDWSIETANDRFTSKLKNWLNNINRDYKGRIPRGIGALAQEYFKERWKGSSFPILKITEWKTWEGIKVPSKMFFVDGGSVYAKDIDNDTTTKKLIGYDYYLGSDMEEKLNEGVIISNPYGRWYDKYPNPYLIKRGIYHNFKIIQSLKDKETEILDQVIPFLLSIKKGFKGTTPDESKTYSNEELKQVVQDIRDLIKDVKNPKTKNSKIPVRATNFDEELNQLIPDLKAIFEAGLFTVAERNILSGLGFIDIAEAVSVSRRESILNPKAFIKEIEKAVKDFQNTILKELIFRIIEQNKGAHRKYVNSEIYIAHTPIHIFQTHEFKNQMRLCWERGQLSNQTYCEVVGEVSYKTEVLRREKETKDGLQYTMYPPIRENREGQGIDIPGEEPIKETPKKKEKDTDVNGKPIPQDKLTDKDKYDIGKIKLETAPYTKITDLPPAVRKKLSPAKQRAWLKIFNNAYRFMMKKTGDAKRSESYAFRVAWSQIKQVKSKKSK